jgi:hypothetical protein
MGLPIVGSEENSPSKSILKNLSIGGAEGNGGGL